MSEKTTIGPKMPAEALRKGAANADAERKAGIDRGAPPAGASEDKRAEGPKRHTQTGAYEPASYPTKSGLTRRDN